MSKVYNVISTTWVEDGLRRTSYSEHYALEATRLPMGEARELANELIDKWVAPEKGSYNRFDNGLRLGAYVEKFPKAWGIRVDIQATL